MKNLTFTAFVVLLLLTSVKCKKLDVRPNSSIIMPRTVSDFERLLEHEAVTSTPALPQLGADEYFIRDYDTWQALYDATARNAYIWSDDVYGGEMPIIDWNTPYQGVFYCNSVLDHISILDEFNERNRLEGWALFARAYLFHSLATTFANAYDSATAKTEPGIPLKLSSNIDNTESRSTLEQTYSQIIQDALKAAELLPNERPLTSKNHPSKAAAYALLARVYLNMRDYENSHYYVDKALKSYNQLNDYNALDSLSEFPFNYTNEEVIYLSRQVPAYSTSSFGTRATTYGVHPGVLSLYDSNDLRLYVYFIRNAVGNYCVKPIKILTGRPFTGLAVDELYLIKAECLARGNNDSGALGYLNQLLATRMKANTFEPINREGGDVLDLVLLERRKALVWRGLRWVDLKRLNKEGAAITLTRELNGVIYKLPPNDPRWIFPIPYEEGL